MSNINIILKASIMLSASCVLSFQSSSTGFRLCSQTSPIFVSSPLSFSLGRRSRKYDVTFFSLTIKKRQTLRLSSSTSGENEKSNNKQVLMKRRRVRRKDDEGDAGKIMEDDKDDSEDIEAILSNSEPEMVEVKIRNIRDEGARLGVPSMDEASERRGDNGSEVLDGPIALGKSEIQLQSGRNRESSNLEGLLADAKRMRAAKGVTSGSSDAGTGDKIINLLSAVVTFDFFVVCGLLLWFLAGVFCSYVLKNDAVQIAFNGIFQPVVQPALGILMIGSAASAVLKGKQNDDENSERNNDS